MLHSSATDEPAHCQPGLPPAAITPPVLLASLHALHANRDRDLAGVSLDRIFSDKANRRWPGVNVNASAFYAFARTVISPYISEFSAFNPYPPCGIGPSGKHKHCLDKSMFRGDPSYTYYRRNGMYEGKSCANSKLITD